MRAHHLIYILCLLTLMGASCRHNNGKTDDKLNSGKQNAGKDSLTNKTAIRNDLVVDTAELNKFLPAWRDRQEFASSIADFYRSTNMHAAWSDHGKLLPQVSVFVSKLENSWRDGLNPQSYRINEIHALMQGASHNDDKLKDLDILLTTQFHRYAADMTQGATRREKEDINWFISTERARYDTLLRVVLNDKSNNDPFKRLEPQHPEYEQLKGLLQEYLNVQSHGGWPALQGVAKLQLGDTSEQVVRLRERLALSGDLRLGGTNFYNPRIFDKTLELSVKQFQTRYGLDPDGIVSGSTLEVLNKPVSAMIDKVKVNLERWRMVPYDFGDDYLLVNVPEYKLHVYEQRQEVHSMRVVVGKEYKSTPVFADKLQYIVFSPYWNLPKSITKEEVVPAMQRNPQFLYKNHMEVLKGWGKDMVSVRPWGVPWKNIDDPGFDYWIRQQPGKDNPLGLVKFIFPNNHNVYLHDTPSGFLFNKVKRAYSHGCIRLEQPEWLAQYLLRNDVGWTKQKIEEAMNKKAELYVNVKPEPVYIMYFTTWIDGNGKVQVRDDLYGLDKAQASYLD